MSESVTETVFPDARGALGVHACRHCGAAFARESYLHLHRGRAHADALTATERAAFEAALAAEDAWLKEFRKHVRGGMNALPAAIIYVGIFLMVYLSGIPPFFGLLLFPGTVLFCALLYYMAYQKESPDT